MPVYSQFSNFMYQIYLPFCNKDEGRWGTDKRMKLVAYPSGFEFDSDYPFEVQCEPVDLSSCERSREKKMEITLSYDKWIEVTKEYQAERFQKLKFDYLLLGRLFGNEDGVAMFQKPMSELFIEGFQGISRSKPRKSLSTWSKGHSRNKCIQFQCF